MENSKLNIEDWETTIRTVSRYGAFVEAVGKDGDRVIVMSRRKFDAIEHLLNELNAYHAQ